MLTFNELEKILKNTGYKINYYDVYDYDNTRNNTCIIMEIPGNLKNYLDFSMFVDKIRSVCKTRLESEAVLLFMEITSISLITGKTYVRWTEITKPALKNLHDVFNNDGNFRPELPISDVLWFIDNLDEKATKLREFNESKRHNNIAFNADCVRLYHRYTR